MFEQWVSVKTLLYLIFEPFILTFLYLSQLLNCIILQNNCNLIHETNIRICQAFGCYDLYSGFIFMCKCVCYFLVYPVLMLQCNSGIKENTIMNCNCEWYEPVIGFFICLLIGALYELLSKKEPIQPVVHVWHNHVQTPTMVAA